MIKNKILNKLNLLIIIYIVFIFISHRHNITTNNGREILLKQDDNIVLKEIISFEKNLNLTDKIFNEFNYININNKLIERNVSIKKSYNPDITVIITIYNQAHCLHKGLRSVQNQSLKNIEIIIIDDCSLDNSTEIIKQYQKEDERIILISHDINEGEIKSRTDGIRKANGKYITIIDGDDSLIHKDILKNSLYIAQKANLDVVEFHAGKFKNGHYIDIYNYSKLNISYIIYQPEIRTKFFFKMHKNYFLQNRVIWSKLIKKDLFNEVLSYLGSEIVDDYINEAEDTLMLVGIFHLSKSYYVMKEFGYDYTWGKKNNSFPHIKNRKCKTNNKLKKMGWYKYLKFLVDKNINNKKEKIITYYEFKLINNEKIFKLKLDNRHYKIMFYVWNKILEFDTINDIQKNHILNLKNKAIKKLKRDNIYFN